jgi:hypothetical protein
VLAHEGEERGVEAGVDGGVEFAGCGWAEEGEDGVGG